MGGKEDSPASAPPPSVAQSDMEPGQHSEQQQQCPLFSSQSVQSLQLVYREVLRQLPGWTRGHEPECDFSHVDVKISETYKNVIKSTGGRVVPQAAGDEFCAQGLDAVLETLEQMQKDKDTCPSDSKQDLDDSDADLERALDSWFKTQVPLLTFKDKDEWYTQQKKYLEIMFPSKRGLLRCGKFGQLFLTCAGKQSSSFSENPSHEPSSHTVIAVDRVSAGDARPTTALAADDAGNPQRISTTA